MSDIDAQGWGIEPPPLPPLPALELRDDAAARDRADLSAFIGPNARTFLDRPGLRRICWPGLLVPQAWLLYRKLYVLAAIVCAGPIVVVTLKLPFGTAIGNVLVLVLGASGKAFYLSFARSAIGRIRSESADDEQALDRIRRAGGVSKAGAAIGIVYIVAAIVTAISAGIAKSHH